MTLKEEITTEAGRRFPSSGYGQDDLLDVAFEMIREKIKALMPELYEPFERMTAERILDLLEE